MSLEAYRAPLPPPRWMVYGVGQTLREGGVMSDLCSPCPVFRSLLCPYLVLPVPVLIISLRLCLITPHLFLFSLINFLVFFSLVSPCLPRPVLFVLPPCSMFPCVITSINVRFVCTPRLLACCDINMVHYFLLFFFKYIKLILTLQC